MELLVYLLLLLAPFFLIGFGVVMLVFVTILIFSRETPAERARHAAQYAKFNKPAGPVRNIWEPKK